VSRDNGTGRLNGGGGIELIRCLNASVYVAEGWSVSRVHRARILVDIPAMVANARQAIDVLVRAWESSRQLAIGIPADENGNLIPVELAIQGFYRHMLTARRGELVGVLPGRTESHVEPLQRAFAAERRDTDKVVRADLAQGFTRYIQTQPAPVRREAERAIGQWMVSKQAVNYAVA
jgi:hypothetical protein